MKYEDILNDIYGYGYYNIIITILCSLSNFLTALFLQSTLFLNYHVNYKCIDTKYDLVNNTVTWINHYYFDSMHNYTLDMKNIPSSFLTTEQCYGIIDNKTIFTCNTWSYSSDIVINNYVTKYDLVCNKSYLIPWLTVCYLLATSAGYIFATFCNQINRKPLYISMILWQIISQISLIFVNNLNILFLLMTLRGFPEFLTYLGVNYVTEISPLKKRSLYGNLYWLSWGFGYMTAACICYVVRDEYYLQICILLPMILYLPLILLLKESPRCLTLQGYNLQAVETLRFISKINKANLNEEYFKNLSNSLKELDKNSTEDCEDKKLFVSVTGKESLLDAFKNRSLIVYLIIFTFADTVIAFVYMGLSVLDTFASKNPFINVLVQGVAEVPSIIIAWLVSAYLGRKISVFLLGTLCGIFVVSTAFVANSFVGKLILGLGGKLCLISINCVCEIFLIELAPTSIRMAYANFVHSFSAVISAFSPLYNDLIYSTYSFISYGISIIFASILIYVVLPETKNSKLPETIGDVS